MDRRYVLLDRDGTLNVERCYLSDPDQVQLLPGAAEGLRRLHRAGFGLVVVTNQSGVGRGYYDQQAVERVHARLRELLVDGGVVLDAIYYCPHVETDGCACRKPRPGMVERAARELGFDPRCGFVVGDKSADIALGRNVGAATLLVLTGYGRQVAAACDPRPDHVADDLAAAAEWILCQPAR